ncbi:MAG: translation elongation factor Ts [Planctomycetota bacterium]|nr:translation elongation factor Ts [Planctomycetota bacterium]
MDFSAKDVMKLRQMTGAGMMDCKKALIETGGDMEAAADLIRKSLGAKAAKKAGRATGEGLVRERYSDDQKKGTMVIVLCETEPVTKTEDFVSFVDKAADVAFATGANSVEELEQQAWDDGESATVGEALKALIGRIGENMKLGHVATFTVDGDGLVGGYVHFNHKTGALVSLTGGTATNDHAKDLCQHIVFAKPIAKSREEISEDEIAKETAFLKEQLAEDPKMAGKPEQAIAGILKGRLDKNFFGERVLLEQGWYRDGGKTKVQDHLNEWNADLSAFALFQIGA